MKKRLLKGFAILLAVILILPLLPADGLVAYAAAKQPALSVKSKTLIGTGAGFTLTVKNLNNSKVKSTIWYSTNKKILKVGAKNGYVTAVGKGTAYAKCKITYKDGTVKRPYCKVTVKIPAATVKITNAKDYETNNNRQLIAVGDYYDFDAKMSPSNADGVITWSIDNTTYATVDANGVVRGIRPGFVRLKATASMTKEGAASSVVNDIINLEIVDKTSNVKSVTLSDNTTLSVTFDSVMDPATLIGTNNKLLNNITITSRTDDKGVVANGLGDLTGTLSTDGKILTIKTTNIFNGLYEIHFTNNIKSKDGTNLTDFYQNLTLYDTTPPSFKEYKVDDSGLKVTLTFSEPMDFTNMQINDVKLVTSGQNQTALPTTLSILSNKSNYTKSADGKSLMIDLSSISSVDYNKMFTVIFSGLKDKAGNYPTNYLITAYVGTDTTPKAQARLNTLERTGYNTLTATFTRSIKNPGSITLSNGEWVAGVVDPKDNTKVNYTLSPTAALLTGTQKVMVGYWDGFNVSSSDTSASTPVERYVNFAISNAVPVLVKSELTIATQNNVDTPVLTLTYNKDVTPASPSGTFTSSLITINNDIYSNKLISYTAVAQGTLVTVVLNKDQFKETGTYKITLPSGFVRDTYMNLSQETTITVQNNGTSSTALPAPKSVVQSPENASIVYVTFTNKVDEITSQTVSNYSILGTTIVSAELIDNTTNGATVKLTLLQDSIPYTTLYPVTITGVTGYHNSYTAMNKYQTMIALNENRGPAFSNITYTYPNTVTLTFTENLAGTAGFQVMQNNTVIPSTSIISGNTVIITLNSYPQMGSALQIDPTQYNNLTDTSGNKASITTRYVTPSR